MGAVLGVSTIAYLPHAFSDIVSPVSSVAQEFTGFKTERTEPVSASGADP